MLINNNNMVSHSMKEPTYILHGGYIWIGLVQVKGIKQDRLKVPLWNALTVGVRPYEFRWLAYPLKLFWSEDR